jgi:uncharacterized delta-60 repeat protein
MSMFFSLFTPKGRIERARNATYRPRVEVLEERCCLSPGSLEWSDPGSVSAYAGLLQPNGDIVAIGGSSKHNGQGVFGLARYTPGGSLDATFGSGGIVTTAFGRTNATAWSAVLYPIAGTGNDGKIVAAGSNGSNVLLARYNSNGTLDTTFGSGGTVTTAFTNTVAPFSAVLQPDGKIVLGGYLHIANPNTNNSAFLLLRYNVNGLLDGTFGQGGEVITNPTPYDNEINSILILPNGDIMAGGYVTTIISQTGYVVTEPALARYTPGGVLDSTFGSGGLVTTDWVTTTQNTSQEPAGSPEPCLIDALALQGDGKIVAAGAASLLNSPASGYKWGLARYNSDGSLDTTFGSGGVVVTQIGTGAYHSWAVALQSNGEIVAAGTSGVSGAPWAVATYTPAGALDPAFGGTGIVTTNLSGRPVSVLIQPTDGEVVVVGDVNLARYIGTTTGPQIGSFTAIPNPVTGGSNVILTASNITDVDPGSSITQVAFYILINGTQTLLGYGTQTSSGVWTFDYTVNLAPGTYTLFAQAEDNYGIFGELFALTLTVQ